ncbi:MAG: hypothetical protein KAI66_04890 [Lentisphaeria bacterium]|nr:hypothetical protein [Lentisphaeria bacterium]
MEFLYNGITAFRGSSDAFPENTMAAYEEALSAGADWLQIDIRQTADGHFVACHDATTGRTADQDLVIAESTLGDLQALDFSAGFRKQWGLGEEEMPASRIPLLPDVLALIRQQDATRLSIQPFEGCLSDVAMVVQEMDADEWVGVNGGDVRMLLQARQFMSEVPIFYDTGPEPGSPQEEVEVALAGRFNSVVVHRSTADAARIRALVGAGFEVGVWTVDDPEEIQALLQLGASRFYTDCPWTSLSVVAEYYE